jgi:hypothetical protein
LHDEEIEKVLRQNLISAYLDYAVQFGEKRALKIIKASDVWEVLLESTVRGL